MIRPDEAARDRSDGPLRIAVDASAAAVPEPSGVAVYIRELVTALPDALDPRDRLLVCYRLSRVRRRRHWVRPTAPNVTVKTFHEPVAPLLSRRLSLFHGPDVRLPDWRRPARVATVHDLFSLANDRFGDAGFRATRRVHYERAVARADRIITHSETVRRAVVETLGVSPERVTAVPLAPRTRPAPSADAIADARARHGVAGRPYAIAIGEVSRRKDTGAIVEAFVAARERLGAAGCDSDPALLIVGRPGFGAEELLPVIAAAGASGVRHLGWLPDDSVAALLAGASLLVQASRDEGFGIPVLEAMAAGVPVVATAAGAVPEVAGDAALLVAPGEPGELTGAIEAVLRDPARAGDLRERGRRRAAAFSWARTARETVAVYRDALATRAPRGARAARAARSPVGGES